MKCPTKPTAFTFRVTAGNTIVSAEKFPYRITNLQIALSYISKL